MEVIVLGSATSQGVPVIGCDCEVCKSDNPKDKRLRSSVLIKAKNHNLLIDSGPDFRQQMLRENVNKIDAILFTHEHKDHTAGLDDVRAYNFMTQKPMDIYAESRVINSIRKDYSYIFTNKSYPGIPKINLHTIGEAEFYIDDLKIMPIRLMHHRLPILGFRIDDFAYITDANYISEEEKEKLTGVKILIINALRKEKHISHFSLEEAIEVANQLGPKKTYLTHVSHHLGLHDEINKLCPENIELAYDGLKIKI